MNDLSLEIDGLRKNIQSLQDKQLDLMRERKEIAALNATLQEKIEAQDKVIKELGEHSRIKNLAGQLESGQSREVKLKINELVREIDKCIAQLNR